MAQIREFTIDGLAGRTEPLTIVLNNDTNVFFGLNGSGKTTLLKILHSALSNDPDILKQLPFSRARVKIFLNRHSQSFVRVFEQPENTQKTETTAPVPTTPGLFGKVFHPVPPATVSLFDSGKQKKNEWTSEPLEPDGKLTSHSTGFLPISRLYRNVSFSSGSSYGGKRLSDQELDSAFARSLQSQWSEYYAGISQAIAKAQERGLANILGFFLAGGQEQNDQSDAPDEKEAYKRISGFLGRQPGFSHLIRKEKEFATLYAKRPELRNVVKHIEIVERSIDQISAPRERFRNVLESMFTGNKHLVFTEKEIKVELPKEKEIGLTLLSSGEKQLLFIALHALVGDNHCLIIDEPELSMHVDWQRKLIATLRDLNPNMQLIMATHSPEIMADIPDGQIFRI